MTTHASGPLRISAPEAYVVLDDDDRIRHVSRAFQEARGRDVGRPFWDDPHARDVYAPHFDEARRTGRPVEATIFYAGRLERVVAIPGEDGLAVHVETLVELDLTSLATLTRSLEQLDAALADRASAPPDPRSHASLQALP